MLRVLGADCKGMMTLDVEVVRENWAIVQERIRLASVRGGWDHKVNVVAATKYVDLDDMDILIQAGIKVVGENRAEELEGKWRRFRDALDFHFIGHLQSRKARRVVPRVSLIHSVDSLSLVEQIDKRTDVDVDVLLQVNVSGEESKYGILAFLPTHVDLQQDIHVHIRPFVYLLYQTERIDGMDQRHPRDHAAGLPL